MNRIFTYILHKDGVIDDSAFELIAAAREWIAQCLRSLLLPASETK